MFSLHADAFTSMCTNAGSNSPFWSRLFQRSMYYNLRLRNPTCNKPHIQRHAHHVGGIGRAVVRNYSVHVISLSMSSATEARVKHVTLSTSSICASCNLPHPSQLPLHAVLGSRGPSEIPIEFMATSLSFYPVCLVRQADSCVGKPGSAAAGQMQDVAHSRLRRREGGRAGERNGGRETVMIWFGPLVLAFPCTSPDFLQRRGERVRVVEVVIPCRAFFDGREGESPRPPPNAFASIVNERRRQGA
eukprot:5093071-Pleurochrysis_carterae.AAC.2